jgi:hypothetical protein
MNEMGVVGCSSSEQDCNKIDPIANEKRCGEMWDFFREASPTKKRFGGR